MITCLDCPSDSKRPAPYPGPRCATHHRAAQKRSKDRAADVRRLKSFGITGGTYRQLMAIQGGCCAGCGKIPGPRAKRLAVDHDHKCCPGPTSCGKCLRGLLCYSCNTDILPAVRDDPTKLRRIADYLEHPPARDLRSDNG